MAAVGIKGLTHPHVYRYSQLFFVFSSECTLRVLLHTACSFQTQYTSRSMKMGQKTYVNDLRANMLTDFDLATTKFSYLFIYNFNSIIVMINLNRLSMTLAN